MNTLFGKKHYIGDAVIALVLVALCIVPLVVSLADRKDAHYANVYVDGSLYATLPLDTDTLITPDGGHTYVAVKNGRAYIEKSDCPDGVCMQMKGVEKDSNGLSDGAVCVPNRVSVSSSVTPNPGNIDAVAG